MTYAAKTTVKVETSQQEIARIFKRYGVDTYNFGAMPGFAMVEFKYAGLPISVKMPLPLKPETRTARNPQTGRTFDAWARHEQHVKEAWRALVLFLKATLEAVERGTLRPEQAFMAFLLTRDSQTLGDVLLPRYMDAIASGERLALTTGGAA